MSYILDALRKAEEERSLGRIPQAKTIYAPAVSSRRLGWTGVLLGFVLLSNVAMGAFIFLTKNGKALIFGDPTTYAIPQAVPKKSVSPPISTSQSEVPAYATATGKRDALPSVEHNVSSLTSTSTATAVAVPQVSERTAAAMPSWQNFASQKQGVIPDLNLDIHVYDEAQDKSFVMINSAHYREGEWLNEGPRLELITEDGVILSYSGQRFHLPVGKQ